ncbi:SCAN domain-containing protein 3 [Trichonephila clavipes]|nr:SCAN domain-containing protein 3 [Trichonephila clavipes]
MAGSKKIYRQYSVDYLKFGFIESVSDKRLPMCFLCNSILSNDAMKPSKLEDHLRRRHPNKRSESIFNVLEEYFIENPIPLSNIISVASGGTPAMVGSYRGFIGHLKQNIPGVLAIHCVIHRHHSVAENLNGSEWKIA